LLFDLKRELRAPETADDTRTLLKTFRKRRDLLASIAEEIDELFKALREMSSAQAAPPKLEQMAEPIFQEPQEPNVATPPERETREKTERAAARLAREKRKAAELAGENRRAVEAARLAEDQKAQQAKVAEEKRKSAQTAERMRPVTKRNNPMLWTIFVILLVLWLLGLVSSYTLGGFIHILLVIAIVVLIIQLLSGRRAL